MKKILRRWLGIEDKLRQYYEAGCYLINKYEEEKIKNKMHCDSLNALVDKQEGIIRELRDKVNQLNGCLKRERGEKVEEERGRGIPKGNVFGGDPDNKI